MADSIVVDSSKAVVRGVEKLRPMLTTLDNPYSPHTEFDEWYAFDMLKGHNTCGLLARITMTSEELSDADRNVAIEDAIDEIVENNALGMYKKVVG